MPLTFVVGMLPNSSVFAPITRATSSHILRDVMVEERETDVSIVMSRLTPPACAIRRRRTDDQRASEVIRGHQRSSEVLRGPQRSSEVIRGHQHTCAIRWRRTEPGFSGVFGDAPVGEFGRPCTESAASLPNTASAPVSISGGAPPSSGVVSRSRAREASARAAVSGVPTTGEASMATSDEIPSASAITSRLAGSKPTCQIEPHWTVGRLCQIREVVPN